MKAEKTNLAGKPRTTLQCSQAGAPKTGAKEPQMRS